MRIELRRGPFARLLSGAWYQPLLALLIVLDLAVAVLVTALTSSVAVAGLVPLIVLVIVWALGASGGASADDDGLRWRLLAPRAIAWSQVAAVDFGGKIAGGTLSAGQAAIRVRTTAGGPPRGWVIGPVLGVDEARRAEFGRGVVELARRHGVPVEVSIPQNWPGLG